MLDGLTPDLAPRLVLAIGGVGLAFLVLIAVLLILRKRNSPLFIKGGKSREPRLMVLDAAAVDAKRRLVLIRRDNVEHLIMIGGPTDIVIESGIGANSAGSMLAIAAERASVPDLVAAPVRVEVARSPAVLEQRHEMQEVARPVEPSVQQTVAKAVAADPVLDEASIATSPEVQIRPRETAAVSAMGSVLYDEDREPLSGNGQVEVQPLKDRSTAFLRHGTTQPVAAQTAVTQPIVNQPAVSQVTSGQSALPLVAEPAPAQTVPLAAAAESILDQARTRVLSAQPAGMAAAGAQPPQVQPVGAQPVPNRAAMDDATRALAARLDAAKLEAARLDAARRAQASQDLAPPAVVAVPAQKPAVEFAPSDFEKLLEAELQAGGIFDGERRPEESGEMRQAPIVTAEYRGPDASGAISGATRDMTAEREMARRLGEMALNKKV